VSLFRWFFCSLPGFIPGVAPAVPDKGLAVPYSPPGAMGKGARLWANKTKQHLLVEILESLKHSWAELGGNVIFPDYIRAPRSSLRPKICRRTVVGRLVTGMALHFFLFFIFFARVSHLLLLHSPHSETFPSNHDKRLPPSLVVNICRRIQTSPSGRPSNFLARIPVRGKTVI